MGTVRSGGAPNRRTLGYSLADGTTSPPQEARKVCILDHPPQTFSRSLNFRLPASPLLNMALSQAQQWQTQQPGLQPAMLPNGGNRNAKNLAMGPAGREWSYGLCACCGDPGTCKFPISFMFFQETDAYRHGTNLTGFFAWCCPCIVYGRLKRRFEHLNSTGYPLQVGGCCNSDCMLYCCACGCCGFEFLVQVC